MGEQATFDPLKVFLEGLPPTVREEQIRELFEPYGQLVDLSLVKKVGSKNLPFAVLTYVSSESASAVINDSSDRRIKGYPISAMAFATDYSDRKQDKECCINVSGLDLSVYPGQLRLLFSQFAPVFNTKIMYTQNCGILLSRGIGRVQFMDYPGFEAAYQTVKQMLKSGQMLLESPNLKVKPCIKARENLYVSGFDRGQTQDGLTKLFSQFGKVHSAKIQRSRALQISLGYGYICYKGRGAAQAAIEALDGQLIDGTTWTVQLYQSFKDNFEDIKANFSQRRVEIHKQKVVVTGITSETTEQELQQVFSQCGEVLRVYIDKSVVQYHLNPAESETVRQMSTPYGLFYQTLRLQVLQFRESPSRPKAFITYNNQESAKTAVRTLNGQQFHEYTLQVEKWKPNRQHSTDENQIQSVFINFMEIQSLICTPFERLDAAQQQLVSSLNFTNDEESAKPIHKSVVLAAFYYYVVSICEEQYGMLARFAPILIATLGKGLQDDQEELIIPELYVLAQDTPEILSVCEDYLGKLDQVVQAIMDEYQGIQLYYYLRNMYCESKYRDMLALSKDQFVKVWDATANKLEINDTNLNVLVTHFLSTKSFMELLQGTMGEIDLSSDVPMPQFNIQPGVERRWQRGRRIIEYSSGSDSSSSSGSFPRRRARSRSPRRRHSPQSYSSPSRSPPQDQPPF